MERKQLLGGAEPAYEEALSVPLAIVSGVFAASFISSAFSPASPYVFASASNLCYVSGAIFSISKTHVTTLFGPLAHPAIVWLLLGGSSFAFHRNPVLNEPEHSLDIFGGWLIVFHVAILATFTAMSTVASLDFKWPFTVVYITMVVVILNMWSTIYENQLVFFFVLGPVAAVFGGLARLRLLRRNNVLYSGAVFIAVFEITAILTALAAAIFSQGELLGKKLSTSSKEYDLYHSCWHFLLATVTLLLFTRLDTVANMKLTKSEVCVCEMPVLDIVGLACLLVYSASVLLCKEIGTLAWAEVFASVFTGVAIVHAMCVLLSVHFRGRIL